MASWRDEKWNQKPKTGHLFLSWLSHILKLLPGCRSRKSVGWALGMLMNEFCPSQHVFLGYNSALTATSGDESPFHSISIHSIPAWSWLSSKQSDQCKPRMHIIVIIKFVGPLLLLFFFKHDRLNRIDIRKQKKLGNQMDVDYFDMFIMNRTNHLQEPTTHVMIALRICKNLNMCGLDQTT